MHISVLFVNKDIARQRQQNGYTISQDSFPSVDIRYADVWFDLESDGESAYDLLKTLKSH